MITLTDPDRPLAQPLSKSQAQHLAYLPHRQSLARHSHPPLLGKGSGLPLVEDCQQHRPTVAFRAAFMITGIGVHDRPESGGLCEVQSGGLCEVRGAELGLRGSGPHISRIERSRCMQLGRLKERLLGWRNSCVRGKRLLVRQQSQWDTRFRRGLATFRQSRLQSR